MFILLYNSISVFFSSFYKFKLPCIEEKEEKNSLDCNSKKDEEEKKTTEMGFYIVHKCLLYYPMILCTNFYSSDGSHSIFQMQSFFSLFLFLPQFSKTLHWHL